MTVRQLLRRLRRHRPFKPDWELPPEPKGSDENDIRNYYYRQTANAPLVLWDDLQDWQRQSWRREYRDG